MRGCRRECGLFVPAPRPGSRCRSRWLPRARRRRGRRRPRRTIYGGGSAGGQPLEASAAVQLAETEFRAAMALDLLADGELVQGLLDADQAGLQGGDERRLLGHVCLRGGQGRLRAQELRASWFSAVVSLPTWVFEDAEITLQHLELHRDGVCPSLRDAERRVRPAVRGCAASPDRRSGSPGRRRTARPLRWPSTHRVRCALGRTGGGSVRKGRSSSSSTRCAFVRPWRKLAPAPGHAVV